MSRKKRSEFLSAWGKAIEVFKALVDGVLAAGGNDTDIARIKTNKAMLAELVAVIMKYAGQTVTKVGQYLRLLSDKPLIIAPTDGKRVIADAKGVFTGGIDGDFKKWNADEPGVAKGETTAQIYEMAQDATFAKMFGSLSPDLNKLCLTQDQIITFCEKHRDQLRVDGYATFFLFKSYEHFFVACVGVNGDGSLGAGVDRFGYDDVWRAEDRHRLVSPRLA